MKFLTTDYPLPGTVGHYRIDAERRVRIEEYQGNVGLADIRSIISSMASDPCWSPDFHGLIDFTEANLELSANDILRLALIMKHEENRTNGWLAFVATNSTVFGIVRMLGYWSRITDRMRIFGSREEADVWLERNMHHMPPHFCEVESTEAAALRNVI